VTDIVDEIGERPAGVGSQPSATPASSGAAEELAFAIEIAQAAGRLLLERYERIERIDYKSARDVVTEVDHLSEELIIAAVRHRYPDDGILAEESGSHAGPGRIPAPEPLPAGQPVTAPMVGTFYAAPTPKDPAYVQEGDTIHPGDRVGIIEAMKMMNEIECEVGGRVARILVKNGQPVEYGQTLMIIEPL